MCDAYCMEFQTMTNPIRAGMMSSHVTRYCFSYLEDKIAEQAEKPVNKISTLK